MLISLTKSGGFAGLTLKVSLDTSSLLQTDREQVEKLVNLVIPDLQHSKEANNIPDGHEYHLTVDGTTYQTSDATLTDPQDELFTLLIKLGK